MDDRIRRALSRGHLIDITTTGRRTGRPRRIELVFHNLDGRIFISGLPSRRRRSWIANLASDPRLTFHLKGAIAADLPATARIVSGEAERREVLAEIARRWRRTDVDTMVAYSPLIEVLIDDRRVTAAPTADAPGVR
ncbi:MAG TPA: nitroreductase/quinone reductase family protein [Candidatus Limnocylindrales bacterium]|jgi:deazaflavin-dependent oxidoreductase (nitroreductase family)